MKILKNISVYDNKTFTIKSGDIKNLLAMLKRFHFLNTTHIFHTPRDDISRTIIY